MKFVKIARWSFETFFQGNKTVDTALTVSEEQVKKHIESTSFGQGNWDSNSLKRTEIEIKEKKLNLTII